MAEPIKNNVVISVCTKGAAPKDGDMEGTAGQYAARVCGNDKVYSSFTMEVTGAEKKLMGDSNYYCRSVNASFFCREPQQGKGSNPSWEEKGIRKESDTPPPVHKKDYL